MGILVIYTQKFQNEKKGGVSEYRIFCYAT